MYCFKCGRNLPEGAAFCPGCGTAQPTQSAAQAGVYVQQNDGDSQPDQDVTSAGSYVQPDSSVDPSNPYTAPADSSIQPDGNADPSNPYVASAGSYVQPDGTGQPNPYTAAAGGYAQPGGAGQPNPYTAAAGGYAQPGGAGQPNPYTTQTGGYAQPGGAGQPNPYAAQTGGYAQPGGFTGYANPYAAQSGNSFQQGYNSASQYGAVEQKVLVNLRTGKGLTAFSGLSFGDLCIRNAGVSYTEKLGSSHNHQYGFNQIANTRFEATHIGVMPYPGYKITLKTGQEYIYIYSLIQKSKLKSIDQVIQNQITRY